MRTAIAFGSVVGKDVRTYYLKPPNISWGILFPLAWTGMFFLRSGTGLETIPAILPGFVAISVLFGTTSVLAVTVTFEKRGRSFDRLLLAPIPLELLMVAKIGGAIVFGVLSAFVPLLIAAFLVDLSGVAWPAVLGAVLLTAVVSALLGLTIAASVREVFEAMTLSNFFRFPMIFLCGLFVPVEALPSWLQPLSYALPLTYGVDLLRQGIHQDGLLLAWLDVVALLGFSLLLYAVSLWNIRRKWIA